MENTQQLRCTVCNTEGLTVAYPARLGVDTSPIECRRCGSIYKYKRRWLVLTDFIREQEGTFWKSTVFSLGLWLIIGTFFLALTFLARLLIAGLRPVKLIRNMKFGG